jgi:sialate O-acetylesterase
MGVMVNPLHFLPGILVCTALPLCAAELSLATPFSDHMVLQRGKPVPVWGSADPGEKISVEFGGATHSVTADAEGAWKIALPAMEASTQPRILSVQSANAKERTVKIQDVLVGEVWLGSGQSNMAMTVGRAENPEQEIAKAQLPLIRVFTESSKANSVPQKKGNGSWVVCGPETVSGFSATLFFFGREIHEHLKVPVGLVNSSVGGTPIESWIPQEAQLQHPVLGETAKAASAGFKNYDVQAAKQSYQKTLEAWQKRVAAAKSAGKALPQKPKDPTDQHQRRGDLGGLFNGKIQPLIPYAIRGMLWYQGEANAHPGKGSFYQHQLPLLVTEWRKLWNEELPFAWVQLPNFTRGEDWCLVREAALKTLSLPKTGMAITIDVGDPKDIHPKNKQEVGRRLSLWALADVYGQKLPSSSGPLPLRHSISGSEFHVTFSHADQGLKAAESSVKGFVVAGADRIWKPATAKIAGDSIIASSPEVTTPVALRYSWAGLPDGNLKNGVGLPASPFRTDDWNSPELAESKP